MKNLFIARHSYWVALSVVLVLAFSVKSGAHQYVDLDSLVSDVCSVHTFDKCGDPAPLDSDSDGVIDDNDQCPGTAIGDSVNSSGCSPAQSDTDGDGVADDIDQCEATPVGNVVDGVGCTVVLEPPAPGDHITDSVPQWQWIQLSGTAIEPFLLANSPESFTQPYHYINGPDGMIGSWNGAFWDESRQQMRFNYNGGHGDYCGNEQFYFDLDDLLLVMVRNPSPPGDYTQVGITGKTPDGMPGSRHSYNGNVYIPTLDKYASFGGSLCSGAGTSDGRMWYTDHGGNAELILDKYASSPAIGHAMVYDSVSEALYVTLSGPITKIDINTLAKTKMTPTLPSFNTHDAGVLMDEGRRKMVMMGVNRLRVLNVDTKAWSSQTMTGPITAVTECKRRAGDPVHSAPGLQYIASLDKYLGWCNGQSVYLIDPDTYETEEIVTTGLAPIMTNNGMYGRFRYSEKRGGILVYNRFDEDAYFLKLLPPQ